MSEVIFYKPSMIIDAVNAANGLAITEGDVILSVSSVDPTNWLIEQGFGDTVVRVIATKEGLFQGETLIAYNRVQLQLISDMVGGFLGIPESVTSVHAALPYFTSRYGITFYEDDIEDTEIVWTEGVGAEFTLTAKATSLIYQGAVPFVSTYLPEELSNIIVDTDLPQYPVYSIPTDKFFAEALVYGVNFSNYQVELSAMTAENYDPEALMNILTPNTSIVWSTTDTASAVGSLFNSELTYNGLNSGIEIANGDYKYLMVVKIRDDSEVVTGSLLIHYNDVSEFDSLPEEDA